MWCLFWGGVITGLYRGRSRAASLPSHRPDGAVSEAQAAAQSDGAGGSEVGDEGGRIAPGADGGPCVGGAVDRVADEGTRMSLQKKARRV